jgi:cytidyltransferase-like protein
MKIVVCTGGFDPLHSGHIAYLSAAATLGNMLIVGVNSDAWLERKKGRAFMPITERRAIVGALKSVHATMTFNDDDGSARDLLVGIKREFPYADIIFANGGDRTEDNIPEMDVPEIMFAFGVGGEDKVNSSSWILEEWKAPKTLRPWGYYRVLHEVPGTKVKELTLDPGQSISLQRHKNRHEYWHVSSGQAFAESYLPNGYKLPIADLETHGNYRVPKGEWHKLSNPHKEPCTIVEIQYGTDCSEDDIERK